MLCKNPPDCDAGDRLEEGKTSREALALIFVKRKNPNHGVPALLVSYQVTIIYESN